MSTIKQHFENEAKDFDRLILTLIPHYPRMLEALIAAIPFDSAAAIRVIDLGCGTAASPAIIKPSAKKPPRSSYRPSSHHSLRQLPGSIHSFP